MELRTVISYGHRITVQVRPVWRIIDVVSLKPQYKEYRGMAVVDMMTYLPCLLGLDPCRVKWQPYTK